MEPLYSKPLNCSVRHTWIEWLILYIIDYCTHNVHVHGTVHPYICTCTCTDVCVYSTCVYMCRSAWLLHPCICTSVVLYMYMYMCVCTVRVCTCVGQPGYCTHASVHVQIHVCVYLILFIIIVIITLLYDLF